MFANFAGLLGDFPGNIKFETLTSLSSVCITAYFWLVRVRREEARLQVYQAAAFRPDRLQCSDAAGKEKATWYGEIYVANPSPLPRTVVAARVELFWKGQWVEGRRVLEKKDDLPWTIEPLRVLSRNLGFSFDVEQGTQREQLQTNHQLRLTLGTLDGRKVAQVIETHGPSIAALAA